jgi:glutaminase
MRRLVSIGIDPGAHDYDRRTPLHIAASEGRMNALQYLLSVGVHVNPLDRWGKTPLDDAELQGHQQAASLLSERGGERKSGAVVTVVSKEQAQNL